MADLKKHKVYKNTKYQVLTDSGFKDFSGLIVGKNKNKIILGIDNKIKLICTPKHKLMISENNYVFAKDLSINDLLFNNHKITSFDKIQNNDKVYELLHVEDTHKYFVNDILCHQCLFIDEMAFIAPHLVDEFWESVIPVVSSFRGTKIIAVSTPNGAGNKFHEIYARAERGESKGWHHERIDWWEIPGRTQAWKQEMMEALGKNSKSFDQEFGNQFIESGHSAIDGNIIQHYRSICRDPIISLENNAYKIWEEPQPGHVYAVGVDVGEGIGQAASVAQILDLTDLTNIKQVACYHNNNIDPFHFAEMLLKISNSWGRPWLLIERNNCGGTVIDTLKEVHDYHNIIDYSPDKQKYYNRLGIYSHTNAKYKGVMNMRYWMNSLQVVSIYDISTVQELETFIKYPNGTWKKQQGEYIFDDRVMSLVWGLFALETEITERYFEIISTDDRGKPLAISPFNAEEDKYFKIDPIYNEEGAPLPAHIGGAADNSTELDVDSLLNSGWKFV
jgi:hypothetical protein